MKVDVLNVPDVLDETAMNSDVVQCVQCVTMKQRWSLFTVCLRCLDEQPPRFNSRISDKSPRNE